MSDVFTYICTILLRFDTCNHTSKQRILSVTKPNILLYRHVIYIYVIPLL